MLLLDTDPIALWGLIVAIIGVLIAIPAAWGAVRAITYAKAAPTAKDLERVEGNTLRTSEHLEGVKVDLARVEGNTAATSRHLDEVKAHVARVDSRLKQQRNVHELSLRASRVSISARGNEAGNGPYKLYLSLQDSSASLTHVELLNEKGNAFGSFPCSKTDNPRGLDYVAVIPLTNMSDWFRGGTPVQTMNRMRLKLTVWMRIEDEEVSRDMAVTVMDTMLTANLTNARVQGYQLEGSV